MALESGKYGETGENYQVWKLSPWHLQPGYLL